MKLIYKFFKHILFLFNPEFAHKLALKMLAFLSKTKLITFFFKLKTNKDNTATFLNLNFKNKLGIAAGLDKNGEYIKALADLGVGFIELGTVTPKPQPGNQKPRLFRLKKEQAIINRMGFNNIGIDGLLDNLKKYHRTIKSDHAQYPIIGINIGKNFATPIDNALDDYLLGLTKAYKYADYISINISSPNTANLRELQKTDYLDELLRTLKAKQIELKYKYDKYTPIALKIAPDLTDTEIKTICDLCIAHKIDAIIATNTTNEHQLLYDENGDKIQGGLSGKPLLEKSNHVLELVVKYTKNTNADSNIIIIGVGGINSAEDAQKKIELGADLVQVYSGMIYQGPSLVSDILSLK